MNSAKTFVMLEVLRARSLGGIKSLVLVPDAETETRLREQIGDDPNIDVRIGSELAAELAPKVSIEIDGLIVYDELTQFPEEQPS